MIEQNLNFLSEEVGASMLARLEWVTLKPLCIVVWGQQGTALEKLKMRYSEATFVTQEADILLLPERSVDLIFSNLALPWIEENKNLYSQWQRLLRPEGLCFFSSLGPDTLKEFPSDALNIHLIDMHDIGDELVRARFADPVLDVEDLSVVYQDANKMLTELTSMRLITGHFICDPAEKYITTYEIIYGHAWATANNTLDAEGVVKIPISHLRRR